MDARTRDGRLYEFGAFLIDPGRRVLTCDGSEIALSPTLFEALLYFVENPGRVVSREELLDAVWPSKVVEDANVSQTIFTLRRALAGAGPPEPIIETVPRRGYRFTNPVRVHAHLTAPMLSLTPIQGAAVDAIRFERPAVGSAPNPAVSVRATILFGMVLLAVVGGVAAWRLHGAGHGPRPANVIALTYFQNATSEPIFDRTLETVLRIDLEQSPVVTLISRREVADTLTLMGQAGDARMTPSLAAEICVRNNGQAVIDGSIARLDRQYLLTATATDCADDHVLATAKTQVAGREAVIPALDRLVGRLRSTLGEPEVSVAKFNIPLMNERTASLAAIKAYSEAMFLSDRGQYAEAIPLYRHAVDLDPNFAAAYLNMSVIYANLYQRNASEEATKKAYNLKSQLSEEQKLNLDIFYNDYVTGDYIKIAQAEQTLTEAYPNQANGWGALSNSENWLGRFSAAIEAGEHAVAIAPDQGPGYVVLARALMHDGRLDEAAAVCARAAAKGLARGQMPSQMMEIEIARNEPAAVERAVAEARGKPYEVDILQTAAEDAYRWGQVSRGDELYARAGAVLASQGAADYTLGAHALDLARLELVGRSRALLDHLPAASDPITDANAFLAFAAIGDAQHANAIMDRDVRERPDDTLLNAVWAPEARAALALRQGHAAQAVANLRTATPYEMKDYDIAYLRGRADLAAKDGAAAAAEFHKILDHPGILPADEQRTLAQLGLARAYALQHNQLASRKAYQQFFADWKDADPDLPPLREARAEYAKLQV